jgi:CRP/FNR family transcriptional regulator
MDKHHDKQRLLQSVPAFSCLTEAQLRLLASSVHSQVFERGATIFHQGSPGNVLYIIVSGQVRIYTINALGQELAVKVFGDTDFFGEMALFDGQPRAASAEAMCRTTTLTLERAAFLNTINTCPPIAASILEVMAARLRQSNAYAEQLASVPAAQRVVHQLTELAVRRSTLRASDDQSIDLSLTQNDLASMSGTTRETVNRVLAQLRDQGLVRVERARVCVLNLALLRKVAGNI